MINGIDVSRWQGNIDWNAVKNSGITLAFIKATGADAGIYTDSKFTTNLTNAKAAGIKYLGAYHYAYFQNTSEALSEADYFKSMVSGWGLNWVALDIEYSTAIGDLTDASLAFLDSVSSVATPVIYSNPSFIRAHFNSNITKYPLWIANYGVSSPSVPLWTDWSIWQYSSTGSVNGISGNVDMDYMKDSFLNDGEANKVNAVVYKGDADCAYAILLGQKLVLGVFSEAALNNPSNAKVISGVYCVGANISVPSGITVIKSYAGVDRYETAKLVAADL